MNCWVVTSLRRDKLLMKSGFMPLYFPFQLVFTPLPHFLVFLLSFRRIRAIIPSSYPRALLIPLSLILETAVGVRKVFLYDLQFKKGGM